MTVASWKTCPSGIPDVEELDIHKTNETFEEAA